MTKRDHTAPEAGIVFSLLETLKLLLIFFKCSSLFSGFFSLHNILPGVFILLVEMVWFSRETELLEKYIYIIHTHTHKERFGEIGSYDDGDWQVQSL